MTQNRVQLEVTGDSKSAEDALRRTRQETEEFTKTARKVGLALAGIGAAGALMLRSAFKAALDERQGINLLDAALRNVGTSYKANAEAIERVIATEARKTNFSDGAQREALQRLITLSGSYRLALESLPLALDVAAGLEIDLSTASNLVGRALAGNTEIFARYGIKLREGATWTEAIAALTQKFGGRAEAAADPLAQLNNAINELQEAIGEALMPVLLPAIEALTKFTVFAKEHPTITKLLAAIAGTAVALGTIGAVVLTVGPALAGLKLAILAVGAALTFLMANPVGIAIVGLGALALAGVAVWQNWDTISEKAKEIWGGIASFFSNIFDYIKGLFESKWGWILPGGPLVKAFLFLKDNWRAIWDAIKETFQRIGDWIVSAYQGPFGWLLPGGALLKAIDFLRDHWRAIWDGIRDGFNTVVGTILGIRDRLVEGLKAIARMVGDPLAAVWEAIKVGIDNVIGLINGAIGTLNKAIDAYNKVPILPDIPNIPPIGGGLPRPGDTDFIGPLQQSFSNRGGPASVVNNVAFNFENISISEARRQVGGMLREIVSDGGLTDVGLQRA